MKFNSKVTGGLAWAGLAIVLAVPTANLLTQTDGERAGVAVAPKAPLDLKTTKGDIASAESELVAPIPAVRKSQTVAKTAKAETVPVVTRDASAAVKKPVLRSIEKTGDPVEDFIASGKELPSYISDAPATAAVKQPQVVKVPVSTAVAAAGTEEVRADGTIAPAIDPIEVASVDGDQSVTRIFRPSLVAPMPYPASMRPTAPVVSSATAVTTPKVVAPVTVTTPSDTTTAAAEKPLIIDEDIVARREALVDQVLSDDFAPAGQGDDFVSGDELEEWDSGSLAEYLERRNMISKSRTNERVSSEPDEGFVIVDRSRADRRVVRRLRSDEREFF